MGERKPAAILEVCPLAAPCWLCQHLSEEGQLAAHTGTSGRGPGCASPDSPYSGPQHLQTPTRTRPARRSLPPRRPAHGPQLPPARRRAGGR